MHAIISEGPTNKLLETRGLSEVIVSIAFFSKCAYLFLLLCGDAGAAFCAIGVWHKKRKEEKKKK